MGKQFFFGLLIAILVLTPILPMPAVSAADSAELFVTPSMVMPGGLTVFTGYGFTPDTSMNLFLLSGDGLLLGTLYTDSNGIVSGTLSVPDVAPGDYEVLADPFAVTAMLTILAPLQLSLTPESGPPGTIVHFSVDNLVAGQLRLDYAGSPVVGPVDVPAGLFEGDFIIPADRPPRFPSSVTVEAVNLIGSQAVGTASQSFLAETPITHAYSISNVQFPPGPIAPGQLFTVTGTIIPAPQGPLSSYDLKLLWKSGSGQVVPITLGTPQLLSNGNFTITGRSPSLRGGDPLLPDTASGGQVGVVFFDKYNTQKSTLIPVGFGIEPPPPVLKIKVVDPQGNPIQGVLVDVRAFSYDPDKKMTVDTSSSSSSLIQNNLGYLTTHPNQIEAQLGYLNPSQTDPFTCEQTNAYGRTDANGIFEVKVSPEQLAMMGKKIPLIVTDPSKYMETPLEIDFPVSVNGIYKGYGKDGKAEVFVKEMHFNAVTNKFYDPVTKNMLNTNPYVVTLYPLQPGEKVSLPIDPKVKKMYSQFDAAAVMQHYDNYLGLGYPAKTYGKFFSFSPGYFPDAWFYGNGGVQIEFQHDPLLYGTLNESELYFTMDGSTYPFVFQGLKNPENGCQGEVYQATIPNLHRLSPGTHSGMVHVQDASSPAHVTEYQLFFYVVPAPVWILNGKYKNRVINLASTNITMTASQYLAGDPNSMSDLDTDVPKVGMLQNRDSMNDKVQQVLYPDQTSSITYQSSAQATALNKPDSPKNFSGTNAGGSTVSFPLTKVQILDTPKMPLYRSVFGIPPIAGATIGADMWFDAYLSTEGSIQFMSSGFTTTTIVVTPEANVYVDAFFDLSAIFGLVSASAHAVPSIGLKMPTSFVDGSLQDSTKCFVYSLKVTWKVKVGSCPLCKKKSGTKTIFNDSNPSPCTLPLEGSTFNSNPAITAETPDPPNFSPAVAVDGFGHTLVVWSDDSNNIQAQLLSGGQPAGNFTISSTSAGIEPKVAFYAPNKAVALWTESSLTSGQTDAATIDQVVDAQSLKYALWNGTSWGVPQNLTAPADSKGDGSVVLAGCLSTSAGCPAGGAVTAVWVRNFADDLSSYQYRIFSAAFVNGNWSAPAAVDPASTGMDTDPSVAYRPDGTAQVAWVRDADRLLETLSDRHIAQRLLTGGAQVVVETVLPAAAAEPSLAITTSGEMVLAYTIGVDPQAFIGNQRQLYLSRQSCAGTCSWTTQSLTDANGRPIHAESPSLTLNSSGQAQIAYRALGFGPAYPGGPVVLPGDALGTILGTGALAQAFVSYTSPVITPTYSAQTGGTVWQVNSVYDPALKQTYTVSSQGSGPALPVQAVNSLQSMGISTDGLDVVQPAPVININNAAADFSLGNVEPSTQFPQPEGDPLTVTVTVLNNGPDFTSGGELGDLVVKLAWDAPVGMGSPAGEMVIPWIEAGSQTLIEFSSDVNVNTLVPPDFPYLPHKLYAQINPGQFLPESNYLNNQAVIDMGGLPVPQGLTGAAQAGDSSVFLEWSPVEHASVTGYRVYRCDDGRTFKPVGSAFSPAFVDLGVEIGHTFLYRVTAYAEDGFESEPGDTILVEVNPLFPVYLPLIVR